MADQNNNANSDDTVAKKSGGASPWDDELDLPPEKPKEEKPQRIIGSLDPQEKPEEKPVPFNIPEEVIEDKIAKKIPADQVIGKDKPISYPGNKPAEPKTNGSLSPESSLKLPEEESLVASQPSGPAVKSSGISELLLNNKPARADASSAESGSVVKQPAPQPNQPGAAKRPSLDSLNRPMPSNNIQTSEQPLGSSTPVAPASEPIVVKESPKLEVLSPSASEESEPRAKPKAGGFHLFGRKSTVQPANKVPSAAAKPPVAKPNAYGLNSPLEPKSSRAKSRGPGKLSWVLAAVVLFSAAIYLTEIGMVSVGLEKIYGIVGLENLWGGLPRGVEPSLAKMVAAEQSNLNFKFRGKISATVDKTKESPVTSPLVAYGLPSLAMTDRSVSGRQSAIVTQYDYYSTEGVGDSTSTSTSDSISSDASSTTDDSTTSASDQPATSSNSADSIDSYGSDQSQLGSYDGEETTIKQLDFEVQGNSSDDGIASTIDLKPIVGSSKRIEVASAGGNLFVKSNDIQFDEKSEDGKWLEYKYPGFESQNTFADFFRMKFDSGFSAKGLRVGNDKLADGRAFHYKVYSMELGEAFAALGLPGSAVDSMSGDIWIGVRDHLLKKIILQITPSISSSVSNLNIELEFYDYGSASAITLPALDNVIVITEPATAPPVETAPEVESTPVFTTPSNSSARTTNDSRRHSDLVSLKTALNSYKAATGRYPISNSFSNLSASGNILYRSLVPKYIGSLPSDPNAASGWWYGYKSDGKTFTLSARFENIYDTEVTNLNGAYLHYVWSYK